MVSHIMYHSRFPLDVFLRFIHVNKCRSSSFIFTAIYCSHSLPPPLLFCLYKYKYINLQFFYSLLITRKLEITGPKFLSFFNRVFIYLFWERVRVHEGRRDRRTGRKRIPSRLHAQLGAWGRVWFGAQCHNPENMTPAKIKSNT